MTTVKKQHGSDIKVPWNAIAARFFPSTTGNNLRLVSMISVYKSSLLSYLPPAEVVAFAEQLVISRGVMVGQQLGEFNNQAIRDKENGYLSRRLS